MSKRKTHRVTCLVTYEVNCIDNLSAQIDAIFMAHGCQQVLGQTVVLPSKNSVRCVSVEFSKTALPQEPPPFDVGDRVKCINRDGTMLNYGSEYTVMDYSTNGIRIEEAPELGWIVNSRFVKVEKEA